ncbi:HNH endonuclease [Mycobacterium hackensackense]|nr:HNH endonuclease [Mycobacterium hackensackense]
MLFDEIAELCGQRNAIDGRLVQIVAELEREELAGLTGVRSMSSLVAWKTGVAPRNAETVVAIARRLQEFPRCTEALREGRLSLDQVGVIAERAAEGSDAHYAELAAVATVSQLRTAIKMEPHPDPETPSEPRREFTKTSSPMEPHPDPETPSEPRREFTKTSSPDDTYTTYRIRLPRLDAAKFDAALQSHHDALIAEHPTDTEDSGDSSPFPTRVDAFMSLVEAGWDTDVARRPHGQHTTVVVHLDIDKPAAALHLGPILSEDERQYVLCDTTCEVWFERHGQPIGSGRTTRTISRRLRRALEHRDHCCVIPGCSATRGLHAHHLQHWEDGGPTELSNLVLLCPYHHRMHHRGGLTLTGPADRLAVTDTDGRKLDGGALARPPTTPAPAVPPNPGPTGERAQWWWYHPFEPQPPPSTN